ncbi:nitroreductase family deazaflavin-dependent oxidoreductase [Saccharopolyspora sp. WRP15-2]|uniref:Nitroreductase family deazaflavin-dependent oxidoreductase n=1 Tax=Saccharopolyspora oryzae TaxID=2997343 RepID=A0ABT4V0C8_9PSEU|nr:nitroreductase family deazaflavin-dependent oxidoreductase [Saccharopolyspora oryzae]MDA3627420.1 nitroreductase family deazaflavin-dependent oxidoreductase [Saccharopolyspora oryzae]
MVRRIPRWIARAPIPLFQRGFGWLLGSRFMMLEHRGRRSGEPRYAALEVLDREPGALLLVSGYGPKSQWFRNVVADPEVRVWTGRLRGVPARAVVLPADEARERLEQYRRAHARSAAALGRTLGIEELASPEPLPDDIAERLPLVRVQRV